MQLKLSGISRVNAVHSRSERSKAGLLPTTYHIGVQLHSTEEKAYD